MPRTRQQLIQGWHRPENGGWKVRQDEGEVRSLLRGLVAPHVDEWRVDTMGNLITLKKGDGSSDLRVMVDAHMDEVGVMITDVDNQGTAKFLKGSTYLQI